MRFGSVCSGIEAASVAWSPLGLDAAWFAEIEPFPSAVLAHHYPHVPNLGDMTKLPEMIASGQVEAPDIFCGGTPCQSFSLAGMRRSLDDARGNLSLIFCEIADAIDSVRARSGRAPSVVFWENVPGVLSTKDNAFGCFLAGLAGEDDPLVAPGGKWTNAGYVLGPKRAVAWRVLDAQYFGVAQRRRRVFVVASARNGFDPATVLFEWDGVRRDTPPSRQAGKDAAGTLASRTDGGGFPGTDEACSGYVQPVAKTICAGGHSNNPLDETLLPTAYAIQAGALRTNPDSGPDGVGIQQDHAYTLEARAEVQCVAFDTTQVTSATNRSNPCHPLAAGAHPPAIAFDCKASGMAGFGVGGIASTMRAMGHAGSHSNGGGHLAVAFNYKQANTAHDMTPALGCGGGGGIGDGMSVMHAMQVRRLTPTECERLQGFKDNYTAIPWSAYQRAMKAAVRLAPEGATESEIQKAQIAALYVLRLQQPDLLEEAEDCPDGPRYKAIGNSWAVPNVRWIGARIDAALRSHPLDYFSSTPRESASLP